MAPKAEHKRHASKHKIDRRLGVNLWGRSKSPLNTRSYAPGQHGQRRKKPTDFGIQLMAKQKAITVISAKKLLRNTTLKPLGVRVIQARI